MIQVGDMMSYKAIDIPYEAENLFEYIKEKIENDTPESDIKEEIEKKLNQILGSVI
jgi:hypothetical protein